MPAKGTRTPSGLLIRGNSGSGGGGPVAPTDPSQLTSLVGWWDASDAASIVSAGGKVSQWSNKKAGGLHLTQATGSKQPATGTRTMNGKNVLDFQGVNATQLVLASNPLTGAAGGTALVAWADNTDPPLGDPTAGPALGSFGTGPFNDHLPYTDGLVQDRFGSTTRQAVGNLVPSLAQARVYSVISAPNDWRWYLDGAQVFNTATNTVAWGSSPCVGTSNPAVNYNLDGVIGEIILCNTALSNTDRQAMEAYLAAKWNGPIGVAAFTPASLPGLAAWYDASDGASIVSAAGKVSQWSDKSGANRHLVQATGTAQPSTGLNTINGKNVITYDAPSSNMLNSVGWSVPATAVSVVYVFSHATNGGYLMTRLNNYGGYLPYGNTGQMHFVYDYMDDGPRLTNPPANLTPYLYRLVHNSTTFTSNVRGGGEDQPFTQAAALTPKTLTDFSIGDPTSRTFPGHLCEMIVCATALSAGDLANIDAYVNAKWGVVAPFTPLQLSNLVGFWDASNLSSIVQAGGLVSQWNDLSGNGHHFVQATGASQPSTGTRNLGGKNVLDFGASHTMSLNAAVNIPQPFTIWHVVSTNSNATNISEFVIASPRIEVFHGASAIIELWGPNQAGTGVQSLFGNHAYAHTFNGASSVSRDNNVDRPASGNIGAGALNGVLKLWSAAGNTQGGTAMVAIQAGVPSAADKTNMQAYINAKWGI